MKNEENKQLCANCSASSMEFCIKYRCPYYTFKHHYTKEEKEYGAKVIAFASINYEIAFTSKVKLKDNNLQQSLWDIKPHELDKYYCGVKKYMEENKNEE